MRESKISFKIQLDEEEFIREFGEHWTDEQFNAFTAGLKGLSDSDSSSLPEANKIDPREDPFTARKILLSPKSTLRIGEAPFVLPLLEYLNASGQKVPPEIQVLKDQQKFYLIKYSVDAKPQGNEKFESVELRLDYPDKQGFLTYSMVPDTELEEKFSAKTEITVALDPNLKFRVPDIKLKTGMEAGGGVHATAEAGFLLHWQYRMFSANVIALGVNSSYVEWLIQKPKRMIGSVEFVTVLCTPKEASELPLSVEGSYSLNRGILWWRRDTKVQIKSQEPIIVQLP